MKYLVLGMALLTGLIAQAYAQATVSDSVEYKLKNVDSGMVLGIANMSQTAGTRAVQWTDSGTADHNWHFVPMGSGQYMIENAYTHQLLGVSNASTAYGAQVLQWTDNGGSDHLWTLWQQSDGNYRIKNVNSGLYLEVYADNRTTSAVIDQWAQSGCYCQEWQLVSTGIDPYPMPGYVTGNGTGVHDPFLIRDGGGTYWLFGTNGTLATSHDRVTFTAAGKPLTPIPSWTNNYGGNIWAPAVDNHNGKYFQYYSASSWASQNSAVGLATASIPNSTSWSDQGVVISSNNGAPYNAIDPNPVQDASGNWWLSFGSWVNGIYLIELDPNTGKQSSSNKTVYHLAQRGAGIEGSAIYHYNGYYYLFASVDLCCQGTSSNYHIVVGRSSSVTGPYYDRGGVNMLSSGGTIVLSAHDNIDGPGGQSLMTDSDGPIIVYHYYNGNANGAPTLGINRVAFTSDGWPYLD